MPAPYPGRITVDGYCEDDEAIADEEPELVVEALVVDEALAAFAPVGRIDKVFRYRLGELSSTKESDACTPCVFESVLDDAEED